MATRDDAEFVKTWKSRIDKAQKVKEKWEEEYEVSRCRRYWKGEQLDEPFDEFNQRKVQINKVHPSVQSNIPSLYFHDPYVRIRPSPALADTPGQLPGKSIDDKAHLLQDLGNTLVRDPQTGFDESTHMSLKESYWALGCVRVLHDAEPVDNPNVKDAPPLKESKDTVIDGSGVPEPENVPGLVTGITEPAPAIREEKFYVKRIPARQVLAPADQSGKIEENAWLGYWSIHYVEDIKRSKLYKNAEDLKASGVKTAEDGSEENSASEKVKLYNLWDQRTTTHIVLADGHEKVLREVKYKRLPLKFLRLDVDPDSFYPIPPIYHQLHPQDEFNDSREWLRLNRKGTVPRYTYDEEAITDSDMKKLESGEMGTYIKRRTGTHQVIEPVAQPNYSAVAAQTLNLAKEEFNELSMQSGEQRGDPQSKTATQAKIMEARAQAQESFDRTTVAKWLASIVEEMILLAVDKMSLNQWILLNADPSAAGFPLEAQNIEAMWQEISHEDLSEATTGMKWTVTIEPGSMSPVAEAAERQDWLQALSLLSNPIMSRLLAASPELRKRTLSLHGIKSARDQDLIGKALLAVVQMEMQMASMGGPSAPGIASQPGAPGGMGSPGTVGPPSGVKAESRPPGPVPAPKPAGAAA